MLESLREAVGYTEEYIKLINREKEVREIYITNIPSTSFYEVSIKLKDGTEFISIPSGAGTVHFMERNNYLRKQTRDGRGILDVIQRRNQGSQSRET